MGPELRLLPEAVSCGRSSSQKLLVQKASMKSTRLGRTLNDALIRQLDADGSTFRQ